MLCIVTRVIRRLKAQGSGPGHAPQAGVLGGLFNFVQKVIPGYSWTFDTDDLQFQIEMPQVPGYPYPGTLATLDCQASLLCSRMPGLAKFKF
eukprot:287166-Rhodomonas_salina.3